MRVRVHVVRACARERVCQYVRVPMCASACMSESISNGCTCSVQEAAS